MKIITRKKGQPHLSQSWLEKGITIHHLVMVHTLFIKFEDVIDMGKVLGVSFNGGKSEFKRITETILTTQYTNWHQKSQISSFPLSQIKILFQ